MTTVPEIKQYVEDFPLNYSYDDRILLVEELISVFNLTKLGDPILIDTNRWGIRYMQVFEMPVPKEALALANGISSDFISFEVESGKVGLIYEEGATEMQEDHPLSPEIVYVEEHVTWKPASIK